MSSPTHMSEKWWFSLPRAVRSLPITLLSVGVVPCTDRTDVLTCPDSTMHTAVLTLMRYSLSASLCSQSRSFVALDGTARCLCAFCRTHTAACGLVQQRCCLRGHWW